MKNYLNQAERINMAFYFELLGLNNILIAENKNFSDEELKCMKYITKWLDKFIDGLIKRVGGKEAKRILDIVENNEVTFKPRDYDGQMLIDKESMENALRYAVEAQCVNCKHDMDYYNTCELYKCMIKLGMGSDIKREKVCEFNLKGLKE